MLNTNRLGEKEPTSLLHLLHANNWLRSVPICYLASLRGSVFRVGVFSGLTPVASLGGWHWLQQMCPFGHFPVGSRSNDELCNQARRCLGGPGNSLEMFSHHS